jgi:hypothetical protein
MGTASLRFFVARRKREKIIPRLSPSRPKAAGQLTRRTFQAESLMPCPVSRAPYPEFLGIPVFQSVIEGRTYGREGSSRGYLQLRGFRHGRRPHVY